MTAMRWKERLCLFIQRGFIAQRDAQRGREGGKKNRQSTTKKGTKLHYCINKKCFSPIQLATLRERELSQGLGLVSIAIPMPISVGPLLIIAVLQLLLASFAAFTQTFFNLYFWPCFIKYKKYVHLVTKTGKVPYMKFELY